MCILPENLFSGDCHNTYNIAWLIAMESMMITKVKSRKTQRMHDLRVEHLFFSLLLCGVLSLTAVAQKDDDTPPKPYIDKLNGFSILPPKEGILNLRKSPQNIVEWVYCNPKTKAVEWLLRVLRVTTRGSETGIASFAVMFSRELADQKDTTVTSEKVLKISGQDAIAISGTKVSMVDGKSQKIYFRRLWVRTTFEKVEIDMGKSGESSEENTDSKVTLVNSEFLLFELVSPFIKREIADSVWNRALESLKILDVEKTLTQLKENSERAKAFLQNLWEKKRLASLSSDPSWYLVLVKDKPVGWVTMQGKGVRRNYIDGFELRLCSMRQEPEKKVILARQQLFVDPKLEAGFWRIYSQMGSGPDSMLSSEEGLLRGDKIVCNIFNGKSLDVREKKVPREIRDMLLPKAIGMLFPLLVDVNKQVGYTFAEYSSGKNKFNMRTFTVLGPEWIDIMGKRTLAVKVTDQPFPEAEASELWLSKDGCILRCRTGNSVIESSTQQQVLSYFPKANLYISAINKLGKQNKQNSN